MKRNGIGELNLFVLDDGWFGARENDLTLWVTGMRMKES